MIDINAKLPFTNCFTVNIQLSITGTEEAISVWKDNFDTYPSALWVHPRAIALANKILDLGKFHLVILTDPQYKREWWSVGTRLSRGFGSTAD